MTYSLYNQCNLCRFRYYNNRYLRKWLLRDSNEMGNSSRKIFETCSRLDLQDAMNMVSKQHLIATTLTNSSAMGTVGLMGGGGVGGGIGVPSPNHLSVNRYLYYNSAHHTNQTKGNTVDFCLTPPTLPIPAHSQSHDAKRREENDSDNEGAAGGGGGMGAMGMGGLLSDRNNNGGPPSIFLTVPAMGGGGAGFEGVPYQGGTPLIDPNQSLTTLFRSYTQSNLSALNNATMTQPIANGPLPAPSSNLEKDFNYDIGNLSYSPSLKDLADAELHHILSEAMFKPFKHVSVHCVSTCWSLKEYSPYTLILLIYLLFLLFVSIVNLSLNLSVLVSLKISFCSYLSITKQNLSGR